MDMGIIMGQLDVAVFLLAGLAGGFAAGMFVARALIEKPETDADLMRYGIVTPLDANDERDEMLRTKAGSMIWVPAYMRKACYATYEKLCALAEQRVWIEG